MATLGVSGAVGVSSLSYGALNKTRERRKKNASWTDGAGLSFSNAKPDCATSPRKTFPCFSITLGPDPAPVPCHPTPEPHSGHQAAPVPGPVHARLFCGSNLSPCSALCLECPLPAHVCLLNSHSSFTTLPAPPRGENIPGQAGLG